MKSLVNEKMESRTYSRKMSFDEPQPDWLELHAAMFHFVPHFEKIDTAWHAAIERRVQRWTRDLQNLKISFINGKTVITLGEYCLIIDRNGGDFSLDVPLTEDTVSFGFPDKFFELTYLYQYGQGARELANLAENIWFWLKENFENAIRNSTAIVFARQGSVAAPLTKLASDQWQYVTPNMDKDYAAKESTVFPTATMQSGEVLYSLFIAIPGLQREPTRQERSDSFILWLTGQINSSPLHPTMSKEGIIKLGAEKFGLNKTEAEQSRKIAIEKALPNVWARPGRPKKVAINRD